MFLCGNNIFVDFIDVLIVKKLYQCFDFVLVLIMLVVMFQCNLYEHALHDITSAQLLLRWPRNVAQIEFLLLSEMPSLTHCFLLISVNITIRHIL